MFTFTLLQFMLEEKFFCFDVDGYLKKCLVLKIVVEGFCTLNKSFKSSSCLLFLSNTIE